MLFGDLVGARAGRDCLAEGQRNRAGAILPAPTCQTILEPALA